MIHRNGRNALGSKTCTPSRLKERARRIYAQRSAYHIPQHAEFVLDHALLLLDRKRLKWINGRICVAAHRNRPGSTFVISPLQTRVQRIDNTCHKNKMRISCTLKPKRGRHSFLSSSQTMRSRFFFLIPFSSANFSHRVCALSVGICFSLGIGVLRGGSSAYR